ncbi:polysaccharide pyruvyl transferase family protein [Polaribacter sp. Z014]|uniref:polysaccharide pyruvyl transferase family protein n=1 Tax=Polaribacter sp. Z014 TaxID=2927126 RepID=UPI0020207105|nr:polysaccharide pyruvyl transferase family protein [Polaribacter sp. Z014]MCL7763386.1 polysaccharide pyruvyl transferase family protein [Polaribacter sp. Z014]
MIRLYNYENNFGDDLSPYIISKLSGEKVVLRKPFSLSRFGLDFLRFFKKLLLKGVADKSLLAYSPFNKVIISIGSILEESTSNSIVWGSGLGSKDIKIKGGEFLAVRGPLSQKRLSELGLKVPEVIGDPAILLPLIYPRKNAIIKKRFKVGVIPHKIDYVDIVSDLQKLNLEDFLVIDLVDPNLEKVMDDFLSCDMILSSSLHGLIVSHSYNIPAVWFQKSPLAGDGSKFVDYFSSVGITPYSYINYEDIDFSNNEVVKEIFNKASDVSLANKNNISNIQKNLLDVAPFKVKEHYKL